MPTVEIEILPVLSRGEGLYKGPNSLVDTSALVVTIEVTRQKGAKEWPPTKGLLKVFCEISYDSGKTWEFLLGFGTGGEAVAIPTSYASIELPPSKGPQRLIRGSIDQFATIFTDGIFRLEW